MPYEFVGANIQKELLKLDKTQRWLADQCGVTKGQINHIIHGKSYPSFKLLSKISLALNCNISVLLQRTTKNE